MFLCKPCLDNRMADAKRTVTFIPVSVGKCEDCNQQADCADPPSSWLPIPSKNFKYLGVPKKGNARG